VETGLQTDPVNQHEVRVVNEPAPPTLAEVGIDKPLTDRARKLALKASLCSSPLHLRPKQNGRFLKKRPSYLFQLAAAVRPPPSASCAIRRSP
jgi:hypothetical protein